jgi:hypothetical protein
MTMHINDSVKMTDKGLPLPLSRLTGLLNVSEDELNRRYEEWMRIATDNVSFFLCLFWK